MRFDFLSLRCKIFRAIKESSKLYKVQWLEEALQVVDNMHHQGMPLSRDAIHYLLQGYTEKKSLLIGRRVHPLMISSGLDSVAFFGDQLIRLFAIYGSLLEASLVFCNVGQPTIYTWHAIISAHATLGECDMALTLYHRMQHEGIQPDKVTFLSVLKICGMIGSVEEGRLIHDQINRRGLDVDMVVGSCLIDMYAKCATLDEAHKVFNKLPAQDVVSWAALIAGYANHGHGLLALQLLEKMELERIQPDKAIFSCTLKACSCTGAFRQGRLIHDFVIRMGFESDTIVGSALIDMYAKCGSIDEAGNMFDRLLQKNLVSWNAIITGYVQHGHALLALQLYAKMQVDGVHPNRVTFLCILAACSSVKALGNGRLIHSHIIRSGFKSDVPIRTALIDMYAKCGSLQEMRKVLEEMPNQDAALWNAMIAGYVQHGYGSSALQLFQKMQENCVEADGITLSCALKACGSIGAIRQGRIVHDQIIRTGLKSDVITDSIVVDMYASCGSLDEAHKVFIKLTSHDVVSWNAMISGYINHGYRLQALQLFKKMEHEDLKPSMITLLCILKAFKSAEAIDQGRLIHDQIVRGGVEPDVVIASALVDMYANCGNLEEARDIFEKLPNRNLISWNAMIAGYAQHGDGLVALELFESMQLEGNTPDKITFSCILQACGSIGSLNQGELVHDQILRIGFEIDVVIGTTLVDMYARCGRLEEAWEALEGLPSRNVVSWGAIIAGYAQHGNYKLALQCFKDMQQDGFKPDGRTYTSILAACSHSGQVDEGRFHFKCMKEDYGITPSIEHLNCMVDLFGRAGCLNEADKFLQTMPILPDVSSWLSLLTACRTYNNVDLGAVCFEKVIRMDPNVPAAYLLMSNIYANAQMWERAYGMLELRKFKGVWKKPGGAWIEVSNRLHTFIAGNKVHRQSVDIYAKSRKLINEIQHKGHVPQLDLVLKLSAEGCSAHGERENTDGFLSSHCW